MNRRLLLGALALTLVAAALPAGASTFVALSDAQLVAQSDAVVVGEVLDTFSYWNPQHSMIYTEAVVYVRDVIAGDAPAVLNVRTAGGTVADYKVEASGFPTFQRNQRQVLFLHRTAAGAVEVTGYRQGQYRVFTRSDGVDIAVPALGQVRLLTPSGRLAARPHPQPLASLEANVRSQADRLRRGPRAE